MLYGPDKVTPATAAGHWGCTFLKSIDLLHSFGDCLDLDSPLVVDGKIFMQFHEWMPPTYDESVDPQMVDETPALSTFPVHDNARSESGFSRSSWRSVATQQSWRSAASWKNLGCMRPVIVRRIQARLHPVDKSTEEHPVPQGSCVSLKPDMVYVQRASCPAEALTVASEIGSQADAPISFGSINIPEDIVDMEVESEGVDMNQETPPA